MSKGVASPPLRLRRHAAVNFDDLRSEMMYQLKEFITSRRWAIAIAGTVVINCAVSVATHFWMRRWSRSPPRQVVSLARSEHETLLRYDDTHFCDDNDDDSGVVLDELVDTSPSYQTVIHDAVGAEHGQKAIDSQPPNLFSSSSLNVNIAGTPEESRDPYQSRDIFGSLTNLGEFSSGPPSDSDDESISRRSARRTRPLLETIQTESRTSSFFRGMNYSLRRRWRKLTKPPRIEAPISAPYPYSLEDLPISPSSFRRNLIAASGMSEEGSSERDSTEARRGGLSTGFDDAPLMVYKEPHKTSKEKFAIRYQL